ncbi:FUSC family protein [Flavivirga aquimarina]|uniref:FUSC family protein n=1 Tax=Flavivirga aquimarina TaxID=2027862 RepID=A0ABT8WAH8_9FLAO|nr:FUSC family protein [Flavivirga aquimarina]MDO5970059.1 FUSC family protein [Flavivirga aquimarina]
MKKTFIFLTITALVLAILLSVLLIYNLTIIPSIIGLIFGLVVFHFSKKSVQIKKIIQFAFLLIIIALTITIYKSIYTQIEITNTETLEITKNKFEKKDKKKIRKLRSW